MGGSLWELTQEQLAVDDRLDDILENCPEHEQQKALAEFFSDVLEQQGLVGTKLDGYAYLIKKLDSEAKAAAVERDFWAARAKSRERKVEWLKAMIKFYLESTGQDRIESPKFKFRLQNNGGVIPVKILDESAIPGDYLRYPPPVPDYELIRETLQSGGSVDGAELGERGRHVRIS